MNNNCYRFKVGDFQCMAVSDGFHTYAPPDFPPPEVLLFANASHESLMSIQPKYNLPAPWTEWVSPYICLVIDTGKYLVLVDTGAGGLADTTGKLLKNLRDENIAPEDIDIVINTHGHPDHLGGNIGTDGNPAFPKARYFISKVEWDFWTSGQAEQKLEGHSKEILLNTARKNLAPIRNKLDLVDQETDIVPGISTITAPGHTPGQIALAVTSKNKKLMCFSDAFLHPVHMEMLEWYSIFDIVPDMVANSRRKLLDMASADKALVFAFHFPFPGLGHIVRKGKLWHWQSIKS